MGLNTKLMRFALALVLPLAVSMPAAWAQGQSVAVRNDAGHGDHALAVETQKSTRSYLAALDDRQRGEPQRLALLKDAGGRAAQLARAQPALRNRFDSDALRIAGLDLPASIVERQRSTAGMVRERSTKMEAVAQRLADAAAQGRHDLARSAANDLLQQAAAHEPRSQKPQRKPNPAWQSLAPSAEPHGLYERLQGGPRWLAAAGSLSGIVLSELADTPAPQPADLAPTSLTQAGADIRAKVNELGNNPVRIHNWVRNAMAFTPGWGATQTADATYANGAGNGYDIANLLVAMLRQANVPARYVYGAVEVPAALVPRWLGVDPNAAAQLFTRAGVPAQAITQGNAITGLRFEHVWVEAHVAGVPSRGAATAAADSWWPMDAAFKTLLSSNGLDLKSLLAVNAAGILDAAKSGAQCTRDYALNLNRDALAAAYANYRTAAQQRLGTLAADTRVGDVIGRRSIEQQNYAVLLDTQPYTVLARTTGLTDLPAALRWRLRLSLGAAGQPGAVELVRDLAELQGQRLTLSFAPETADDASALRTLLAPAAGGALPSDIAAYLVRVKAELRLNGQVVASGGSFVLGEALELRSTLSGGNVATEADNTVDVLAGELHAWALSGHGAGTGPTDAQRARLQALEARLGAQQTGGLGSDDIAGEFIAGLAQAYAASVEASAKLFQRSAGTREWRLPTVVRASARLQSSSVRGIVTQAQPVGVALVLDRLGRASNGSAAYNRQSLERTSAAAHQLLEQLFGASNLVDAGGRSALRDIARAAVAGQRLYLVDNSNAASVVPQLDIGAAEQERVTLAANAGLRLLAPSTSVVVDGLAAVPIVGEDRAASAGLYAIDDLAAPQPSASGRIAGGASALGWSGLLSPTVAASALQPHLGKLIASLNATASIVGDADGVLWSGFAGRNEVIDSVFVASLNTSSTQTPCDWAAALLTTQLGSGLPASTSLNRAPVIQSLPVTHATQGQTYSYAVQAYDPDGQALRYALKAPFGAAVPTGLAINAAGVVSWASTQAGNYPLIVQVDDGQALAEQRYTLSVDALTAPPQLNVALSPSIVNAGEQVTLQVLATGAASATLSVTLNGQALAVDASGTARFVAPASGTHSVRVTVTSGGQTQVKELILTVRDAADSDAPVAQIASPAADSEVTRSVPIVGTATDSRFAYYQLLLRPAGASDSAWTQIARSLSPVTSGTLGTLDTSTLANGGYELALRVVDVNGRSTSAVVAIEVARDLKLGQFRLSFADIRAEANGVPLTLTRTYDSTQRDVRGDFGWGWRAAAQDVGLRKNMVLGLAWTLYKPPGSLELCLEPSGQRRITVSLPDGGLYRFAARNRFKCASFATPPIDVVFDALPLPVGGGSGQGAGVAQLEVVLTELVQFRGDQIITDEGATWNPSDYKLTIPDGAIYHLREGVGILRITDPYGNTVDYGQGGYQHSAGLGLQLARDAQGRITRATDPAGKSLFYAYNASGELATVTDRSGKVTRFDYASTARQTSSGTQNSNHLLSRITDPDGKTVVQQQFDEYGRLSASADALGQQATQSFDELAGTLKLTNRRGHATTYTFDAAGNVTRIVDAKGGVTDLTYDANGNELTRKNPLGHTVAKTFDATTGTQTSETNPLGQTTSTTYSASAFAHQRLNPKTSTDAKGNVTSYGYADDKQPGAVPTSIAEPLGRSTSIGIDTKGNLKTLNVAGIASTYDHDTLGRRIKETDGTGAVTTYTFDANGNELTRTVTRTVNGVARTETTASVHDAENRLIQQTDPTGAVTRTTYNSAGKPTTQTDALGRVTKYSYDANARPIKTEHPDGTAESTEYDANGNEVTRINRQGRTTRMVYDELDRPVQTTHPDGTSTATEYDAAGRVTASVDASGARTRNEHDAAGRITAVIETSGRRTEYAYDANGNRTRVTVAAGTPQARSTLTTYDALNRATRIEQPDASVHTVVYRADGRKQSETDPRGVVSTYGYDAAGRLTSVTQSGVPTATTYAYDQTGAKTTQTDAKNNKVTWSFDTAGRPISRTLPDGQKESFEYDLQGQLTAHTTFGGQRITITYDSAGRPSSHIIAATAITPVRAAQFTYNADGQRQSHAESGATSAQGNTSYGYDAQGRLVQLVTPQGTLAWAYDAAGRISERSTSEGTTRYQYDPDGRLALLTAPDGKTTRYSYDSAGRQIRSEQQLDGVDKLITERRYDPADRQVAIAHGKQTVGGATPIAGQKIDRGPGGAVRRIDTFDATASFEATTATFSGNPSRVQLFGYDANARLQSEREVKGAQLTAWLADNTSPATQATSYGYDQVGNRTSKTVTTPAGTESTTYAYDANDRLTGETLSTATGSTVSTTYGWDSNGNLQSKQTPSEYTAYVFDADNRLVEVKRGASQPTANTVAKYGYDADGQRVRKETASGITQYLIDPTTTWPQVVLESKGTQRTAYTWGDRLRGQSKGNAGSANSAPTEALTPLQGHLGATIAAVDKQGNVVERYEASAFGELGNEAPKANHQYTGEYWDAEAKLTYLRARWYEPATGRMLSVDPAMGRPNDARSLNRYVYADSDPAQRTDPLGAMSMGEVGATLSTIVTLASHAMTGYSLYQGATADGDLPVPAFLWGAVFVMEAAGAAGEIMSLASNSGSGNLAAPMSPQKHHTIPQYLCGHKNQKLVLLPFDEHALLHVQLDKFGDILEKMGKRAAAKVMPSRQSQINKMTVQGFGKHRAGRAGIVAGLAGFYTLFDWWTSGTFNPAKNPGGAPTIEAAFWPESERFAFGGHTSCK